MSNLTSTLTLQLVDDGLAKKAAADAEALKRLGASGADLKKLAAANPAVGKLVTNLDALAGKGARIDAFKDGTKALREQVAALRSVRLEADRATKGAAKRRGSLDYFEGVKATDPKRYAKWVKDGLIKGTQEKLKAFEKAEADAAKRIETIKAKYLEQGRAVREARSALIADGIVPGRGGLQIAAAEKRIAAEVSATNEALRQRVRIAQAAPRASARGGGLPSLIGGMGAAGRAQLGDVEARRRIAEGMGAPARASREAAAAAAEAEAERLAARRQEAHEARKTIAGAGLIYAGHKAAEKKKEVLEVYREVDDLSRYQGAVSDLTEEERQSRMRQAMHIGATSGGFNDIQALHAQLDLAQRGVKKEFIEPFIGEVVNYARAMNTDLGSAAKTLEGIVFSTNQDVEDPETAQRTMRRNVDQAVKLAKIGGLDNQDVAEAFKFGGPSGSGAGLHNETMGAIFALLRRSGFAGSEAGVATRAAASKLVSPTAKGLSALTAMGLNYNDYATMPLGNRPQVAESFFKNKFGKGFTAKQRQQMDDLMNDPDQFGDQNKFIEAATSITSSIFDKVAKGKNKGKMKATDQKALAKVFATMWTNMVESVDTERLFHDILNSNPTLQQSNAFFTDKHGGKFQALARKAALFDEYVEKLKQTPEYFARDMGDKRNAGYAGASKRLDGSWKNLYSTVGQSLDNGGRDGGGLLTGVTSAAANAVQSIAELPKPLLATGAAAAYLGGKLGTIAGTALLTGTAIGVSNGTVAAIAAGKGGALLSALGAGAAAAAPIALPLAGTAAVGAALIAADKSKGIVHGGKNVDTRLDWSDELPGMGGDGVRRASRSPSLPPGAAQPASRAAEGVKSLIDQPATPKVDTGPVDGLTGKLTEAQQKAAQLAGTTATPQVNTGPVDSLIAKIMQAIGLLGQLENGVAQANAGIAGVNASAGQLRARSSASFSDANRSGRGAE